MVLSCHPDTHYSCIRVRPVSIILGRDPHSLQIIQLLYTCYNNFDAKKSRSRARSPITTILKNSTMVPRTPLRSISANRERGHELSPYFRGQIISLSKIGTAQAKIAHLLNVSRTTVQYTPQQEATRIEGTTLARSGRPPILSEDDKVSIFNIIKRNPFIGYDDIRDQSGFNICNKAFL
jgi:hypothetical protein